MVLLPAYRSGLFTDHRRSLKVALEQERVTQLVKECGEQLRVAHFSGHHHSLFEEIPRFFEVAPRSHLDPQQEEVVRDAPLVPDLPAEREALLVKLNGSLGVAAHGPHYSQHESSESGCDASPA